MAQKIEAIIGVKGAGKAQSSLSGFAGKVIAMNQALELAGKALRALSATFGSVIAEGREFGAQMSTVKAVTKGTEEQMSALTEEARKLGATTSFTASEAGAAMEQLGRAGQSTTQIIETTGQALNLAAANGVEMADSANLIAIQMNVFKKEGLKAQAAADLINKTISSSPQNFEDFRFAMQFAGQTASAFNRSFEETTQIIGALAETGVRGTMAGTALSMAFARLAKPVPAAMEALKKYGITLDQINPATHEFADIVDVLNKANMTQSDIFTLLGARTAPKFFKLIEEGGDSIRNFKDKQTEANTALDAARTRLNNLDGDITIFNSALSGLKLEIFTTMDKVLRGVVQGFTALVTVTSAFVKNNEGTFNAIFEGMASAMEFVADVIEVIINTFGTFLRVIGEFIVATPVVSEIWDSLVKIFESVFDIISFLLPLLIKLGNLIADVYIEAWSSLAKIMLNIANTVLKALSFAFSGLRDLIVNFPDHLKSISKFFDDLRTSIENIDKIVNDLIKSFGELVSKGFSKVFKPLTDFAKKMGIADLMSQGLDMTLTGNTVTKSLDAAGQWAIKSGIAFESFSWRMKEANKEAKSFDKALQKIIGGVSGGGTNKGMFDGLGDLLDISFDKVTTGLGEIFSMDNIGSVFGSVFSGLIDSVTNLFMSNEKFKGALDRVFETIGKVVGPVIEAFVPVLDALSDSIEEMAPFFEEIAKDLVPLIKKIIGFVVQMSKAVQPIIKAVIEKLIPLIEMIMDELGPVLIELTEGIGGIISAVLDILIPIIQELVPIIKTILEVLVELMPLLQAVLELIQELLPILLWVIRIIAAVIKVFVTIMKPILATLIFAVKSVTESFKLTTALLEATKVAWGRAVEAHIAALENLRKIIIGVLEVLKPIFDAIVKTLAAFFGVLVKIFNVFKPIFTGLVTALKNLWTIISNFLKIFQPIFEGLKNILTPIWEALGNLVEAIKDLFSGGGSGAKGLVEKVLNPFGFAEGTGALSRDQLVRLPGMESNAGLIKAHVGESVGKATGQAMQMTFNISAIDPKATSDELRRLLEELKASGRI